MASQFHVNGLAELEVNTDGLGFDTLGYSVDGVEISMTYETEDVFTDKWGPKIPEDVLNYGQWATVKCQLTKYDNAVLETIQPRLLSATNYGGLPNVYVDTTIAIGALMGQCLHMFELRINRGTTCTELADTTTYEGGWQFGAAYLADADTFKIGTRVTVHDLTFRCLPDASGVLFTKTGT